MKQVGIAMLILAAVVFSGCASTAQCQGPWTPINPPVEAADET
jgi:hypothetical protein